MSLLVVLLAACLVSFVNSTPTMDPHQLELKQHYEHLAYIAGYPCHEPQARVIPVHKLFSEQQAYGKAYFPDVTVLHRCDDCVGSCSSGMECVAKLKDKVLLPFKATYLEDIGQDQKGSWKMEYHELLNHTECHCAKKPPKEVCHNLVDPYLVKKNEEPNLFAPSGSNSRPASPAPVNEDRDYVPSSSSRPYTSSQNNFVQGSSTPYPNIPIEENVDVRSTSENSGAIDLSSFFN